MKKLLLLPIVIAYIMAQASIWTSTWSLSEHWLYSSVLTLIPAVCMLIIYVDCV